jgi:hypothetical protein
VREGASIFSTNVKNLTAGNFHDIIRQKDGGEKMKATILDTQTGLTRIVDGPRSWEWAENNYSCDCNRHPFDMGDGMCEGCKRYLVIKAEFNDPDDYIYTLKELNSGYPEDLRKQFGLE